MLEATMFPTFTEALLPHNPLTAERQGGKVNQIISYVVIAIMAVIILVDFVQRKRGAVFTLSRQDSAVVIRGNGDVDVILGKGAVDSLRELVAETGVNVSQKIESLL